MFDRVPIALEPIPYTRDADQNVVLFHELPTGNNIRWTSRRKVLILNAIEDGAIEQAEAAKRYHLTEKEIEMWRRHVKAGGVRGLSLNRMSGRPKPRTSKKVSS